MYKDDADINSGQFRSRTEVMKAKMRPVFTGDRTISAEFLPTVPIAFEAMCYGECKGIDNQQIRNQIGQYRERVRY